MGVDHIDKKMTLAEWDRRIKQIAKATLQNAAVGRAGIRVYDGGWIRIEDGGLQVTGTASVSGRLEGSGTFDWTGPMNLQGPQTVAGNVTYTGQMTVNGPWKMVGAGEITGSVNVKPGGRIIIEGDSQIVLEQSGGIARMKMGASEIRGGSGIGLYPDSGPSIISTSAGLRIYPLPTISGDSVGLPADTIYINSTGFLYRTI